MLLKYSFIFFLAKEVLCVPVGNEDKEGVRGSRLRGFLTVPTPRFPDGSNYVFEDKIMEMLEHFREIMKEGDKEKDIPPVEPLRLRTFEMNFYLGETDLKGMLGDTVIGNLSDFKVRNLTLDVSPKVEAKLKVSFDQVHISGYYDLLGVLFGEYPVKGIGEHKTDLKGLTLSAEAGLGSKAGIPCVRHLNATFDLQGISVSYKNFLEGDREQSLKEEFVLHLLQRLRTEYLPSLLNTLRIVVNDFLVREEETVQSKLANP